MTGDAVAAIRTALDAAGYAVGPADLGGLAVLVGRRSEFRWRWAASRLHTFVVVARFDPSATAGQLDQFLDRASRYAMANKGGLPKGLQTGTAAVAVAVVDRMSDAAVTWAQRPHGRRYAAMTYPVAADAITGQVVTPRRMLIGAVFNAHLHNIAQAIVAPAITAS